MDKVSLSSIPFASKQSVTDPEKSGYIEINTLHSVYLSTATPTPCSHIFIYFYYVFPFQKRNKATEMEPNSSDCN